MTHNGEETTTIARRPEGVVTRWNPWDEMNDFRRRMDNLFGRDFGFAPLSRMIPLEKFEIEPPADIHETDDKFAAQIALPGYTVKDINVEATADEIRITGERKSLYDEKAVAHRKSGVSEQNSFSFYYKFPIEIDAKRVKATFTNGILNVEMPKTQQAREKSVKINVQQT